MDIRDFIIHQIDGNVYWKDKKGRYLGCNEAFSNIIGLAFPDEIIGKTDRDLFLSSLGKNGLKAITDIDQFVISTGEEKTLKEIGVDKNYKKAYYLTRKIPLRNENNEIIGLIGISVDITELKSAEEREKIALAQVIEEKTKASAEEELRRAVTVLSGSIAHDLRTPIAIVEMSANSFNKFLPALIEGYCKAEEANLSLTNKIPKDLLKLLAKSTQTIQKTTQEMHGFIDVTLKTLSKALSGELTQEDLVSCSIWHCLHNTLARYPFADGQRSLIKWDQKDFNFMGNEVLMIRVLSNLINNSLQQIEKNQHGEISISTEESNVANIIRFKDTAGGASPEIADHLFDGYQTTKEKATGVGLAFCKLSMKSFGGDIVCNSVHDDHIEFVLMFAKI